MKSFLPVFTPLISVGINIICQICICRYIPKFSLLKSVLVGFVTGIFSLLSIEVNYLIRHSLNFLENFASIFANIITYLALAYMYFHVVNLGETARRIRLLRELYDSKKGLSIAEILRLYSSEEIVEKRINRLIDNGQIIFKDNKYYIGNPIMLWIAKIIVIMKMIFLGNKSEFDEAKLE